MVDSDAVISRVPQWHELAIVRWLENETVTELVTETMEVEVEPPVAPQHVCATEAGL